MKNAPGGIGLLLAGPNVSHLHPPKNVSSPLVDLIRYRPNWAMIQPIEATLDFTEIDGWFAVAEANGKQIGLSVGSGVNTPQWVFGRGAKKYFLKDGSHQHMAFPWDPIYLPIWKSFVGALGARYDGNPTLGYIVMGGVGQNIETYVAKDAIDLPAMQKWAQKHVGLTAEEAWLASSIELAETYNVAFPATPFLITLAKPFPRAGISHEQADLVEWSVTTYPGRLGFMSAALAEKSTLDFKPNEAINQHSATQPCGYQTLWHETNDEVPPRQGSLDISLEHAVEWGAGFVELYGVDLANPALAATIGSHRDQLKANAAA